jgi:hypothetical protein
MSNAAMAGADNWNPRRLRRTIDAMGRPSPTAFAALLAAVAAAVAVGAAAGARSGLAAARPPAVLADGSRPAMVPAAVRRFARRPVLGAKRIAIRALPRSCRANPRGRRVRGWLSPEGVSIVYTDRRSSLPRACDAILVGRRWERCSVGVARSRDPRRIQRAGGALGVCTRGGRWRAFMWIRSSRRSAWALVARRGYWVAYRTAGVRLIRISGTERRAARADRFRTTVVFLDRRGRVVERRRVVGAVAG